jgi:hypothetical protein
VNDRTAWRELVAELETVSERLLLCGEANLTQIAMLLRRRDQTVRQLVEQLAGGQWDDSLLEDKLKEALAAGSTLRSRLEKVLHECREEMRELYRESVMAQALRLSGPPEPRELDCQG